MTTTTPKTMPRGQTDALLDHFFRRHYGTLVARLTRILGRLDLAEVAAQEAQLKALRIWPLRGVPDDPGAWLLRVARNHALDVCRRERRFEVIVSEVSEGRSEALESPSEARFEGELSDDTLSLMFLCAHPRLSRASRVALMLKIVGGFGSEEIARTFFVPTETIARRLRRARESLREVSATLSLPPPERLAPRLDSVLDALYLIFNQGYTPSDTDAVLRLDTVDEALRLTQLLARHPLGQGVPHVHALCALMCLQSSRLEARICDAGHLLPLDAQDRTRWDRGRIMLGLQHLAQAAAGEQLSEYHLQAGIAACHATAPGSNATDWLRIVSLYEDLVALNDTPLNHLGHAIAVGMAHGAGAGLRALDALPAGLEHHHLYVAARADSLRRLGRHVDAGRAYADAAQLAPTRVETEFLEHQAVRVLKACAPS